MPSALTAAAFGGTLRARPQSLGGEDMKIVWVGLGALLLAASVSGCTHAPKPIPVGTNSYYYGRIDAGSKFGVTVGDTRETARARMTKAGYAYNADIGCENFFKDISGCAGDERADSYSLKEAVRHGNIDLQYRDGRVVAILWDFNLLPSVDL